MPATINKTTARSKTSRQTAAAAADTPQRPAARRVMPTPGDSFDVMLGNGCQNYLRMADGVKYVAGTVYTCTAKKRDELYAEIDDVTQLPMFYEAAHVRRVQAAREAKDQRRAQIEDGRSTGEIDTGAGHVTLADEEGEAVGVRGGGSDDPEV